MSIKDIIEGKKECRAHMARVKALPQDYQIVYKEIQKPMLTFIKGLLRKKLSSL
jgi:DNA-binding ferritin-like protein (Dps family)